ncbi:hypothetical protein LWI29_008969 [Acer saccharum]|uniref:Uncharacterized protein n=1 Tax=Acer saccharum TaxID=4024 RepID=A0AA39T224_ACESA|nr:hypothetical protein LWI29_008969 [Acer saccharum]
MLHPIYYWLTVLLLLDVCSLIIYVVDLVILRLKKKNSGREREREREREQNRTEFEEEGKFVIFFIHFFFKPLWTLTKRSGNAWAVWRRVMVMVTMARATAPKLQPNSPSSIGR